LKILTFDIEIKKCIKGKDETSDHRYQYCDGWGDYEGMGISVLCAYASWKNRYMYFDEKNLLGFIALIAEADVITGFNIFGFDTALLKATLTRLGMSDKTGMAGKCYDILRDIKKNCGGSKGWNLDAVVEATFGEKKNGDGSEAPRMYQDGKIAELYNYVTQDVYLEHKLFMHVLEGMPVSNGEGDPITLTGIEKWQDLQTAEQY